MSSLAAHVDDIVASRLSGQTILITGASGFIGDAVVRLLSQVPCTVRRLGRDAGRYPPLPPGAAARADNVTGDIRQPTPWLAAVADADVVIHLAAQTSVYTADADPAADLAANVTPILHLVEACRVAGRRPAVVAAGTATQVGMTTTDTPVDESRPDDPITIYDLHKWMAERYLETYTRRGMVSGTVLRLSNVYGPGPVGGSADRGFLNAMVKRAVAGESLRLYGTGAFVRDYIYVDDVARAFLLAAACTEAVQGQHFIVGSGSGTTVAEALGLVAARVAARTGRQVPITSVEPPASLSPIEGRSFVADTARLRAATGWTARVSLTEGIDRTIDAVCAANTAGVGPS